MEVIVLVKSMTGFGRETTEVDDTRFTIEVRSVNHRFLDLSVKMPKSLLYLEERMKKTARKYFKRGRIDIFVTIEGEGLLNRTLKVDWNLFDQYMDSMKQIKERYHLEDEMTLKDFMLFQEPFSIEEQEKKSSTFENTLIHTLEAAMQNAEQMRIDEGIHLQRQLLEHIHEIERLTSKLETHRFQLQDQYKQRITKRLQEFLQHEILGEDSRIFQEVALMAEKGDITEEINRLQSHINQFKEAIKKENDAIGRKLDFIIQEMHREVNTIGSKSIDVKISEWVVELKSEIEKLKEQSQNVE